METTMREAKLPKGYEPQDVEPAWIRYWEDKGSFTPDPDGPGRPYSIVIPPPNITGSLHMGHALNLTLQDILCRYHRQKGFKVLWIPGTDHAGIATQNVVERALAAEGKTRSDLGREKFVERVWEWKEEYGGKILNQIRRMGASVDWSRLRFTMDEGLSRAVREVFVRLYEEGLIYRGDYIINWCPRCHTALADLEVEFQEVEGGLYHIRYPLCDGSGEVVVATTRPETMLGDTAVAVHPEDERYSSLVGREVHLPLTGRRIPVIADTYVDRAFGTGCLKVTPAHDMNDFELGRRHDLGMLQVIDDAGLMTPEAGDPFVGMDRVKCRKKVVENLRDEGYLARQEKHLHNVGHCYRCRTVIEPYVSRQWFVAVAPLAKKAAAAVANGSTRILPSQWEKTYFEWLDNIRDWCISRQIWWGHRIPAWTCLDCEALVVSIEDPSSCPHCKGGSLVQDEDVLDTWFSSALWPFSTLGWPDRTRELGTFYPTSVLVTAFDILFFWVARMMMMGVHFMGQVPFRDVYIHALVRDAQGKKMSKSTGNVIDPLVMIERYGTDAFRFTLTAFAAMGRDIKMSEERIEGYRHFMNKIWNASRFAMMNLPEGFEGGVPERVEGLANRWILHRLEEIKRDTGRAIEEYRFNDAAQGLYQFVWHELCDWYLEMIKTDLHGGSDEAREESLRCLKGALSETLTLLHPIIPFITQEIWSHLMPEEVMDLTGQPFPPERPEQLDPKLVEQVGFLQEVVVSVRAIRSELGIPPSKELRLLVRAEGEEQRFLEENRVLILSLARLSELSVGLDVQAPKGSGSAVVKGCELYVPLEGAVDIDAELARLERELAKVSKEMEIVSRKVANEDFVAKAPADVVARERQKAEGLGEKLAKMQKLQDRLRALVSRS
jgi:valyl-tRNA synthetase